MLKINVKANLLNWYLRRPLFSNKQNHTRVTKNRTVSICTRSSNNSWCSNGYSCAVNPLVASTVLVNAYFGISCSWNMKKTIHSRTYSEVPSLRLSRCNFWTSLKLNIMKISKFMNEYMCPKYKGKMNQLPTKKPVLKRFSIVDSLPPFPPSPPLFLTASKAAYCLATIISTSTSSVSVSVWVL